MSPFAARRRSRHRTLLAATMLAFATLLAAAAAPALADVAPTPPPPKRLVPLELRRQAPVPNKEQVAARIVIPRGILEEALGAAAPTGGASPLGGALPWGTVVAGLCMAAALVSIPFALRGRRAARPALAATVAALVILGGWSLSSADVGVPFGKRPERPRPSGPNRQLIQIEVANEDSNVVQLFVRP